MGGDIDTLAVVIRRWLEAHGRLMSPKFIVGESYGGFRGPKLARKLLDQQGVGVAGLFLLSPVLDFNGRDAPWSPFRYVDSLPSMAAAYRQAQSRADVADVEHYAIGDFLADLLRGEGDQDAVDRLATHVAAITGLDPALVRRHLGRVSTSVFLRERSPGRVDSPYDATVGAADPFPAAVNDNSPDPLLDGMRGPITGRDAVHLSHLVGLAAGGRAQPAIRDPERAGRPRLGLWKADDAAGSPTPTCGNTWLSTRRRTSWSRTG